MVTVHLQKLVKLITKKDSVEIYCIFSLKVKTITRKVTQATTLHARLDVAHYQNFSKWRLTFQIISSNARSIKNKDRIITLLY
jgi:hypothetical protein